MQAAPLGWIAAGRCRRRSRHVEASGAEEKTMRSDSDIKRDVEDELRWEPRIDATDIAVAVKNGVVTLTGFTHSYADKFEAETTAKRVRGVIGLANDMRFGCRKSISDRTPYRARRRSEVEGP